MNQRNVSTQQRGFTLMELLVVLAVLAGLATMIIMSYDGSRSSAQKMIANMGELSNGLMRMRQDVGCYTNVPAGLFDQSVLSATATYCGQDMTTSTKWQGPYVTRFTTDAKGLANFDSVSVGVVVSIGQDTTTSGKHRYYLSAANVPNDIIIRALNECNSSELTTVTFDTNKCRAAPGTGNTLTGTFDMMFDETK